MRKKVTYEAADRKAGFTADELRDALRRALVVVKVRITVGGGKPYAIEVEEADSE